LTNLICALDFGTQN